MLRIATRGSALALAQARIAATLLREARPSVEIEFVEITTEGDRDRTSPLAVLGGRGVFVKAVEAALLTGEADLAVHSLKDVPTAAVDGLTLAAFPPRGEPRDALAATGGRVLATLPPGARIGTSSPRRVALLRAARPDVRAVEIRGNVDTRLRLLHDGEYDALVLAAAGLERLGRASEASQLFDRREFVSAPGQGALALQCRSDDAQTRSLLTLVDDVTTRDAVTAERGFLAELGAGCSLPVGASAIVDGDQLELCAMLEGTDGVARFEQASGERTSADEIGRALAAQMKLLAGVSA